MPQRQQASGLRPLLVAFGPACFGVDPQRGPAAVYRHDRTVYQARVAREEVGDGRGHLLRASDAADRVQPARLFFDPPRRGGLLCFQKRLVAFGNYGAERPGVGADA